ncbi:MAG: FtsQ-type POTRA domain-containing protein [Actinobacteria bacterium]|nr:FtsQ-type POTRA domain-containing protein [Actinomycetota bacterium]
MVDGKEIARSKAEERQQKLVGIRRKRRIRSLVILMVVFAVLIGIFQLYRSGMFNVKNVNVVGNKSVPLVKVREACSISDNSSLLSVPIKEIRERILKDPWIKDVTIKRRLPDTLRIEIKERIPIALISHSQGGKFYLIDEDLFVIAERQYADGIGVPTITDLEIEKIKVGDGIVNDSLDNAIKCLKSMDPSLRKTISLLAASSVDKLSLYLSLYKGRDNVEILYGESKQAEEKNKVLQTILKEQGQQVILIDIRNFPQSDPVIKRIDVVP